MSDKTLPHPVGEILSGPTFVEHAERNREQFSPLHPQRHDPH